MAGTEGARDFHKVVFDTLAAGLRPFNKKLF